MEGALCAASLLLCAAGELDAKDLDALAGFVTPAYVAMDFTAICARNDSQFIPQNSGPRGNAIQYAEQVKDEAITSLTPQEAASVVKKAADAARSIARRKLQELRAKAPKNLRKEVDRWCSNQARSFVREFIDTYDRKHELLQRQMEAAKR
jgi:hypothetical protein